MQTKEKGCQHKRGHESRADAVQAIEMTKKRKHGDSKRKLELNAYHCSFCKRWHIGHSQKWRKFKAAKVRLEVKNGNFEGG